MLVQMLVSLLVCCQRHVLSIPHEEWHPPVMKTHKQKMPFFNVQSSYFSWRWNKVHRSLMTCLQESWILRRHSPASTLYVTMYISVKHVPVFAQENRHNGSPFERLRFLKVAFLGLIIPFAQLNATVSCTGNETVPVKQFFL